MRTVLLIAYHFPPVAGSSGMQRTLRFAQYLPSFGWKPVVLTVKPGTYEQIDPTSLEEIPEHCEVVRTSCLDVGTRLPRAHPMLSFTALPDRWASWRISAVRAARKLVAKHRIQAVWSTYPIATAHSIGASVSRHSGAPWIADFRDPMAQDGYPGDIRQWRAFKEIEETAAAHAARLVFVSPSALAMYRDRYPHVPADRFALVENGFDEESFQGVPLGGSAVSNDRLVLLHSGSVYPRERNPKALFQALSQLASAGVIRPSDLLIRFRASVHETLLRTLASRYNVEAFIDIQPAIPYGDALREMTSVDALLVMQGADCNGQIPAKVYEYLRAGRPILGLTDPAGDTGRLLSSVGISSVASLESVDEVSQQLSLFVQSLRSGTLQGARPENVARYSRRALTQRLAAILDEICNDPALLDKKQAALEIRAD